MHLIHTGMDLYECTYVLMHVCVNTMRTCVSTNVYVYRRVCLCVCVDKCTGVHMDQCVYVRPCVYVCEYE